MKNGSEGSPAASSTAAPRQRSSMPSGVTRDPGCTVRPSRAATASTSSVRTAHPSGFPGDAAVIEWPNGAATASASSTTAISSMYVPASGTMRLAVPQPGVAAAVDRAEAVAPLEPRGRLVEVGNREQDVVELGPADGRLRYDGTCRGLTTGSWTLHGKSIPAVRAAPDVRAAEDRRRLLVEHGKTRLADLAREELLDEGERQAGVRHVVGDEHPRLGQIDEARDGRKDHRHLLEPLVDAGVELDVERERVLYAERVGDRAADEQAAARDAEHDVGVPAVGCYLLGERT